MVLLNAEELAKEEEDDLPSSRQQEAQLTIMPLRHTKVQLSLSISFRYLPG